MAKKVFTDESLKTFVDETKAYADGKQIEITQAAYDALVNAGTVDENITYYITDGDTYVNGWKIEQVTTLPSDAASKLNTLYIVG